MTEVYLDLRGLRCPLPALRTEKALAQLSPSARLVVVCTDPLAGLDIPNLVRETGNHLVTQGRAGAEWTFHIQKSDGKRT